MLELTRRGFTRTIAGAVCCAGGVHGQSAEPWAGDSIVDCHHHMRATPEASIAHLDGCRISNALVLARETGAERMRAYREKFPGRFLAWFAATDITKPGAE